MSKTNRELAEKIVMTAWARAPHLELESYLVDLMTQALDAKDAEMNERSELFPSDDDIYDAAEEWAGRDRDKDECQFIAGARWLKARMNGKGQG